MKRTLRPATALPVLLAFTLAGCSASKSENPTSPAVAGPIAGVDITQPRLLEPTQGFKVKESQQPLKLVIENSTTNGARALSYAFEIAADSEFSTKVYARSGVPQGADGKTSVTVDRLDLGRAYYWRVRAEDGANNSNYASASFEVLPKPLLTAPTLMRPVNGETSGNRRPELKLRNSEKNSAIGFVRYGFQISTNASFTAIVSSGVRDEGFATTEFIPDADLAANTMHFWRATASDGETTSAFSAVQSFRTPSAAPAPSPNPGPAPVPPGNCASNNGPFIASCIAAKYPERLVAGVSLGQRQENMAFIRDRMIEAGRCGGMDLARNLKRGGPELSIDFLVHRTGGEDIGVDIGIDYDNTGSTLKVVWNPVGPGAFYSAYPNGFSCQ
jgi:hypothetical protein